MYGCIINFTHLFTVSHPFFRHPVCTAHNKMHKIVSYLLSIIINFAIFFINVIESSLWSTIEKLPFIFQLGELVFLDRLVCRPTIIV